MPTNRDLALLKAFETVLTEGRFLDESIGTILDTALRFFDADAVAVQPAGGASAAAGTSSVAAVRCREAGGRPRCLGADAQ